MVSFELSKEIEKDAFTTYHKPGQRKSSKSPYSIIFLYIIIYIIFCKYYLQNITLLTSLILAVSTGWVSYMNYVMVIAHHRVSAAQW